MFAQTARFPLAFEIGEREENGCAARRDGQGIGAANQTQRGDFAKREGEAFQCFALSLLVHLRSFPTRSIPQMQAAAKANRIAPMIHKLEFVIPADNPNTEKQAPDAPKHKANTARKP
jgi:hypothetical protein